MHPHALTTSFFCSYLNMSRSVAGCPPAQTAASGDPGGAGSIRSAGVAAEFGSLSSASSPSAITSTRRVSPGSRLPHAASAPSGSPSRVPRAPVARRRVIQFASCRVQDGEPKRPSYTLHKVTQR